jgi:hypothetical protein
VYHPVVVRVLQRPGGVRRDPERIFQGQLRLASEPIAEALPFDERPGEPEVPCGIPGVVDGQDVRVLKAADHLYFALKPLGTERVGQLGMQHLERHAALVPEVMGKKHRRHAAPAKLAIEPVAVGQAMLDLLAEVCHVGLRGRGRQALGSYPDAVVGDAGRNDQPAW